MFHPYDGVSSVRNLTTHINIVSRHSISAPFVPNLLPIQTYPIQIALNPHSAQTGEVIIRPLLPTTSFQKEKLVLPTLTRRQTTHKFEDIHPPTTRTYAAAIAFRPESSSPKTSHNTTTLHNFFSPPEHFTPQGLTTFTFPVEVDPPHLFHVHSSKRRRLHSFSKTLRASSYAVDISDFTTPDTHPTLSISPFSDLLQTILFSLFLPLRV